LQSAEVELVAILGRTQVTLGQILGMKVGDVIALDIGQTIVAEVDHVPVMECRYGLKRGQYALKVERFITQEDTQR
jgi:flagellar motor switch protein FliM